MICVAAGAVRSFCWPSHRRRPSLPAKASARLLEEFSQIAFTTESGHRFHVTFSAGVAAFPNDGDSLRSLVERADVLLYEGKRAGRNQVVAS
jgi:diguanylate cyclase (GGDEF)-like protein